MLPWKPAALTLAAFSLLLIMPLTDATKEDYYRLVDTLFGNYKKEVRPATDYTAATTAEIQLHLLSIQDLEEQEQVLVCSVIIDVRYFDTNLEWQPSNYSNISHLIYPQNNVWLPDIVVENSVESLAWLGYKEMTVNIHHTGEVAWQPMVVTRTSCDIDVTYYPFDQQTCTIILTTWASTREDVDIDMFAQENGLIELASYSRSGTWSIVTTKVRELPTESETTRIAFDIVMKRRPLWYIMNIMIPIIALSLTASLVFFLPADAGEKMGTSITVLLAYAVYLTIVSESMPKTSLQISIIGIYICLLLIATALAVMFSTLVLYLHHIPEHIPVGRRTRSWVIRLRSVLCLNLLRVSEEDSGHRSGTECTFLTDDMKRGRTPSFTRRRNKVGVSTVFKSQDDASAGVSDWDELADPMADTDSHTGSASKPELEVTWKEVAETLDRLLFYVFSLFTILNTLICICVMAFASP